MKACGLVVEYNPLHNGHVYHIKKAKESSSADCMIAVMSGSFLQRGEPAIIDKFHRTKMALASGIDIVVELPFSYAVQSSELFAKGAVQTLHQIGVSSICFGSESGEIEDFMKAYHLSKEKEYIYTTEFKEQINKGYSYPRASKLAYEKIGLTSLKMDLSKPNNILGFSYVKEILDNHLAIEPLTIKRTHDNFHNLQITNNIASATSIRHKLLLQKDLTNDIEQTMPEESVTQLINYKNKTTMWHSWEKYFPLLHYRIMTMSIEELRKINGVNEGLEYRIKEKAKDALSFFDFIQAVKTKRYTWTRLQRVFVHILAHTKKSDLTQIHNENTVPYIRLLGLTSIGKDYLKNKKKQIDLPILSQFNRNQHALLTMEERATDAYYSILPAQIKNKLRRQELNPPIII